MTQTEFAEAAKINLRNIQRWIRQEKIELRGKNSGKLAKGLGMTVSQLRGVLTAMTDGSPKAGLKSIVDMLSQGVPLGAGKTLDSRGQVVHAERPSAKLLKYAPVVGRVAAGPLSKFLDVDYPGGFVDHQIPVVAGNAEVFAMVVDGDSMSPRYVSGDLVVARRIEGHESLINGGAYVFSLADGGDTLASFKLLFKHATKKRVWVATPINPDHESFEVRREEMLNLGHVYLIIPRQR